VLIGIIILFLWTNSRHEGSHALMAYLEGFQVVDYALLPGIHEGGGFYFGYVLLPREVSWLTFAGPFISDLILVLIVSFILFQYRTIRFFNVFILFGFISPLIELIYNYQGGFWRMTSDVYRLHKDLPSAIVHLYFISLIVGVIFMIQFFRKRRLEIVNSNDN